MLEIAQNLGNRVQLIEAGEEAEAEDVLPGGEEDVAVEEETVGTAEEADTTAEAVAVVTSPITDNLTNNNSNSQGMAEVNSSISSNTINPEARGRHHIKTTL